MRVAVRQLVEFSLLRGDLRSSFVGPGRATAGTREHRRVQRSRPEGYEAEVSLQRAVVCRGLPLEIFGRADGVWMRDDGVLIDEIKTTTTPLLEITAESFPMH